jgi:hypothetical protein
VAIAMSARSPEITLPAVAALQRFLHMSGGDKSILLEGSPSRTLIDQAGGGAALAQALEFAAGSEEVAAELCATRSVVPSPSRKSALPQTQEEASRRMQLTPGCT